MITNYHQNHDFSIWIFDGLGNDPITMINQLYDVYTVQACSYCPRFQACSYNA